MSKVRKKVRLKKRVKTIYTVLSYLVAVLSDHSGRSSRSVQAVTFQHDTTCHLQMHSVTFMGNMGPVGSQAGHLRDGEPLRQEHGMQCRPFCVTK